MAGSHNFGGRTPNKEAEKIIVRSEGWLASTESFEIAPRDDLKKRKLAHQGRQALAYRLME